LEKHLPRLTAPGQVFYLSDLLRGVSKVGKRVILTSR